MHPTLKNGRANKLQVYCFGAFRVVRQDEIELLGAGGTQKIWSIFKYLLVHRGNPVPTQRLMEIFWRNTKDYTDTAPLRTTFSRLKMQLQTSKKGGQKDEYIVYNKDFCIFNGTAPCWIDSEEFEKKCRDAWRVAAKNTDEAIALFCDALQLYQGDFLSGDLYHEWTIPLREYYHKMYIQAVQDVSASLIEKHDFHHSYTILKRAIEIDPYIEKLHILVIKCLIGLNDFKAAVDHYSICTSLFYKDLGLSPSLELRSLYKFAVKQYKVLNGFLENFNELITYQESASLSYDSEFFINLIQSERSRITRYGGSACLVIMEIVEEKPTHQRKHLGIEEIETVVGQCLRKSDMMSRLNQNFLGFLLPMTDLQGGQAVLSHINEEIRGRDLDGCKIVSQIFSLTPLEQNDSILPWKQRHIMA